MRTHSSCSKCSASCDLMDPSLVLRGFVAGGVATLVMLVVEIPMLRRFGSRGVFEWHEIQASVSRVGGQPKVRMSLVFLLHLLAGGVAGLLFATAISFLRLGVPLVLPGLGLGFVLWLMTLVLHEAISGVHPWRNEMGRGPVTASLIGHLLYGAALGFMMAWP